MKLEANKGYTRRDGSVTGPLEAREGYQCYPFCDPLTDETYNPEGSWDDVNNPNRHDLISEYIEPSEYLDKPLDNVPTLDVPPKSLADLVRERDAEIERLKVQCSDLGYELDNVRTSIKEERDTLRARLDEQERQLQAYETQLTLQEDGPKSLLERLEKQRRDLDYYAGRVEEVESARDLYIDLHKTVCDQRDELRRLLDDATASEAKWIERALKAEEQLTAPTQPKLVKQTWQPVMHSPKGETHEYAARVPQWFNDDCGLLGFIRRDTYQRPDGTTFVECVLESINEG